MTDAASPAVLWKISHLFAEWLVTNHNILFDQSLLTSDSLVLEIGCGIAGVVALTLAPRIRRYIATDQGYVLKVLKTNLEENVCNAKPSKQRKRGIKSINIEVMTLDWEASQISSLPDVLGEDSSRGIDAVIACDCIYNETLIDPFVQTCAELCRLRPNQTPRDPTVCIVAQQLRSSDVFEIWLRTFMKVFTVWRLPDEFLTNELASNSGFAIHIGILRDDDN